MEITYDKSIDVAYISLAGDAKEKKITKTDSFMIKGLLEFGVINIDFDAENKIVGFEILNASRHIPGAVLSAAIQIA